MSLTIAFSSEAKRDLKRLYRRHPGYADELLDVCPTPTTRTYWTIRGRHTVELSSSTSWTMFS